MGIQTSLEGSFDSFPINKSMNKCEAHKLKVELAHGRHGSEFPSSTTGGRFRQPCKIPLDL